MTTRTIGNVLSGNAEPKLRRTFQPVHRNSRHSGERERREWLQHNRFPRTENNARMRALEEIDRDIRRTTKEGGKRCREAHVMKGVYRWLLRLRGRADGRLDPSYQTIAAELGYAASAVKAAMKRLEELGFVRWIRRTRLVENPQPGGQYVEQVSNAYVLELAGRAAAMVRKILRRPTPEQAARREAQQKHAEHAAMSPDQAVAVITNPELKKTLSRMLDRLRGASPSDGLNPALKG